MRADLAVFIIACRIGIYIAKIFVNDNDRVAKRKGFRRNSCSHQARKPLEGIAHWTWRGTYRTLFPKPEKDRHPNRAINKYVNEVWPTQLADACEK